MEVLVTVGSVVVSVLGSSGLCSRSLCGSSLGLLGVSVLISLWS